MVKMMIRGGDLDLVEYEFSAFSPGENLQTLGFERAYPLTPVKGKVTAQAPARIHLTVLDMNRFAPGHPGGGGVGFAVEVYCRADVECIPSGIEIDYERSAILRHFADVFRKVTGYRGGFRITAVDHKLKHVGLGSTSTMLIAFAHALNRAVGSPLTPDQLRFLLGNNFVEETADGRVAFGFETGVGPYVSTYGGMGITGDRLTGVYHHPFAADKNVYIIIPPTEISSAGEREFDLLMNRARNLDYKDRDLKAYLIMMDLIPALERDDLTAVGDVIWEIEFRGSKRAEVEHHGFRIYHYMNLLREQGFEFVGMSSVGPAIALITKHSRAEVQRIIAPLGLEIAVATKVDNTGLWVHGP